MEYKKKKDNYIILTASIEEAEILKTVGKIQESIYRLMCSREDEKKFTTQIRTKKTHCYCTVAFEGKLEERFYKEIKNILHVKDVSISETGDMRILGEYLLK